jgi:hypothetical protein
MNDAHRDAMVSPLYGVPYGLCCAILLESEALRLLRAAQER